MTTRTMKQWVLHGKSGIDALKLEETGIPQPGENEVLIKIHTVSLNFRDLMIATGTYYWKQSDAVVPVSDGAGEVISIGAKVKRFIPGQRVMPTFFQGYISGTLSQQHMDSALGALPDGVLREYAVFNEDSLVHIPSNLSYEEASTLPCAALTAWNCLYGSRPLQPGDTVLTQGTGGVSIFALQFAVAAGAETIATTSSETKEQRLKQLGAHHVINYRKDPEWGTTVRKLSLNQQGANYVVEIGGPGTLQQSSKAAAVGGEVAIVGRRSVDAGSKEVAAWNPHAVVHSTRRIAVGSRLQFEDMNRAIEVNKIRPVIDRVFAFEDAKKAFKYVWNQEHIGKVVIRVAGDISS
ncbi:quinone oxidoreductase, putative [Talaromyces stipitatus ATCC 10500]|uniref:Quinone oxidoreductase, putative n=1 Tax=Talaromyces stipitatus (strain ATCC 10500 / CBS 375.48 / QM 6759 / NRRL 1006) TaxID=441959 RepID=B8M277_TALSN|nr:quinone oxidoreductase, putative [Talaromyces stipitatus ATCC 10500]EED21541.1 quinone oxidoreductase, putative [Talaromyces stipitatus ATCC 10500]